MPLEFRQLQGRRATAVAHYAGEDVRLDYRPELLDAPTVSKLQSMLQTAEAPTAYIDLLARLVAEWDITEDGAPMPVTRENLTRFGVTLLDALASAILLDMQPAKNGNGRSPDTS